ncbi:hypothetical protein HMPREF1549_01901 [Actinomyces johnsonii F0510]|uniref:Uncharacterized protein n=1 Tax=Actinomyces johnsonii F0510 TaxID=1227262 RepID=U1PQ45_9ACTO|nr:hypothetical protein HMPREF1549_01901 [Actinomyces johnsonii F0510]
MVPGDRRRCQCHVRCLRCAAVAARLRVVPPGDPLRPAAGPGLAVGARCRGAYSSAVTVTAIPAMVCE